MTDQPEITAEATPTPKRESEHRDWIERAGDLLYVRFQCGPHPKDGWYEHAYICVDDGEPDMRDVARTTFGQARTFLAFANAALTAAAKRAAERAAG